MSRLTALAVSSTLAGLMLAAPLAQAGADPTGVWLDNTGRGAIEIKPCGKGLCGHVVWVKDNTDTKKGCGKQIVGDVTAVGGGRWGNGWIYSPEKRRNYDVELQPLDNGNLRVVGYAGTKLFSKTMIWKPAPADLQRCGTIEATTEPSKPAETAKVAAAPEPPKTEVAPKPAAPIETSSVTKPKVVETPAPSVKEPAPAPKPQEEAATETPASEDDDNGGEEGGGLKLGDLNLGDLNLEKVLTKTKGGKCKLDLPWVKVNFDCGKE